MIRDRSHAAYYLSKLSDIALIARNIKFTETVYDTQLKVEQPLIGSLYTKIDYTATA